MSRLGPKIWEIVPEIKELLSLNSCIKNAIKNWKPTAGPFLTAKQSKKKKKKKKKKGLLRNEN